MEPVLATNADGMTRMMDDLRAGVQAETWISNEGRQSVKAPSRDPRVTKLHLAPTEPGHKSRRGDDNFFPHRFSAHFPQDSTPDLSLYMTFTLRSGPAEHIYISTQTTHSLEHQNFIYLHDLFLYRLKNLLGILLFIFLFDIQMMDEFMTCTTTIFLVLYR